MVMPTRGGDQVARNDGDDDGRRVDGESDRASVGVVHCSMTGQRRVQSKLAL